MTGFVNGLMNPTRVCMNQCVAPWPNGYSSVEDVVEIAKRCFALFVAMTMLPAYCMGLMLKCCVCIQPVVRVAFLLPNLSIRAANAMGRVLSGVRTGDVREAIDDLNQLRTFENNPTFANYQAMSEQARYLVAGRYTYPYLHNWTFKSKEEIRRIFENEFRGRVQLLDFHKQGIQEGILCQEKILFAKSYRETKQSGGDVRQFENIDAVTYRQLGRYMAAALTPDQGIDRFLHHMEGAYKPTDLPVN